jgi:hypothetical protein
VSRAALKNHRRRDLRKVAIPPELARMLEPGTRAFTLGPCRILVSKQAVGWHLSISRPDRLPSWEEIRDARYALIPDEVTMAALLPPRAEYVNVHEFCMQLYQVPDDYVARQDTL